MLAVWFIGITWQVFFNVIFVVILKTFLEEVFFRTIQVLVYSQQDTFYPECYYVKNGTEEKCVHGSCEEI